MGIAQIALDPPFPVKQTNLEKKVPPTILPGKPLHPRSTWEKSAQNHTGKPLHPPLLAKRTSNEKRKVKNKALKNSGW